MFDSVRVRLTLWYTLVLALTLIAVSALTYFLYWHSLARRTDGDLAQLCDAFLTTFNDEVADATGPNGLKDAARETLLEHRFRGTFFGLVNDSGVVESSLELPGGGNHREHGEADNLSPEIFRGLAGSVSSEPSTVRVGRDEYRVLTRRFEASGRPYTLVVLQSLHAQKRMMGGIRSTFLWAIPVALLLASAGGYFLARKSLAPIVAMASEARSIGAANLQQRLPVANDRDELGELAQTFNQLLGRLEAAFDQQRRFMADASHELRTPVAILRGEAEVTLSQPERSPSDYRETLAILQQEAQRLGHIIEDLFTLARADAGQFPLTLKDTYLDEIAGEALVRARSLASAKKITLRSAIEPDLPIHADGALLDRMLLNLLDNAIKHSPSGSTVSLACGRQGDRYVVSVSDNGPGIPAELQGRVFERFFRADKARSRAEKGETGGAGLGLSIARWIAEAHHGSLVLARSDQTGSTFSASLPVTTPV
ncbi:MAG TPA: ATP-binding protein [Candidatus Sulfotelmatobacter sp.]|nr:ATP-binding protein [Candidatus Sulfotelmatobacter sp.]